MPFVELVPKRVPSHQSKTGVRFTLMSQGPVVTLSGDAVARLGNPPAGSACKILHDNDKALPRLRIEVAQDGKFVLGTIGKYKNSGHLAVRLGKRTVDLGPVKVMRADCTWEPVEGKAAIDIDLPRELRDTQPDTRKSTSPLGDVRPSGVTLPKVRGMENGR